VHPKDTSGVLTCGIKIQRVCGRMVVSEFLFIRSAFFGNTSSIKACSKFLKTKFKAHGIVIPDCSQGRKKEGGGKGGKKEK